MQDNWVEQLPFAEFAYNNSVQHSTQMTPFWANYDYHSPIYFKPPKAPSNLRSDILVATTVSGMEETHWLLLAGMLEALVRQSRYAGGMDVTLDVENKVWLLA